MSRWCSNQLSYAPARGAGRWHKAYGPTSHEARYPRFLSRRLFQGVLAQPLEFIPNSGRLLELEIARVLVHLLFERFDFLSELGGREGRVFQRLLRDLRVMARGVGRAGVRAVHDVGDGLLDAARGEAVRLVVGELFVAAPFGLLDRALHGARHPIGIQNRRAVEVARGAANGLD